MEANKHLNIYSKLEIIGVIGLLFFIGHLIFAISTTFISANTSSSSYYDKISDSVVKSIETITIFQRHTVIGIDVIGLLACTVLITYGDSKKQKPAKNKMAITKKSTKNFVEDESKDKYSEEYNDEEI